MSRTRTATLPVPAAHTERLGEAPPAHFRRLLGQRRLFGQLAECHRSHHGENTTTDMLDDIVRLLTDELEIRFADHWEPLEAKLLVAELALQHDPTEGPMVGCGICHEQQQKRPRRTGTRRRPGTARAEGPDTAPATRQVA